MKTLSDTDRVERSIVINAPRGRVWRALTTAHEFGRWFGADLSGQTFAPGSRVRGRNTACGHEDVWFDAVVERVDPQDLFSYRWHPYAIDPAVDYSHEERTLVTFTLGDAPGEGTLLTVVETGFDRIPAHRRQLAWSMHDAGWQAQLSNVARHTSITESAV